MRYSPPSPHAPARQKRSGFTLIELLVVLMIVSLLLTLSLPRYFQHIESSKVAVLKSNLRDTRDIIGKFYEDTGHYPDSLQELVDKRYLRALPVDPVTESDSTWLLTPPEDPAQGQVYDLHSGAAGETRDGTPYRAL